MVVQMRDRAVNFNPGPAVLPVCVSALRLRSRSRSAPIFPSVGFRRWRPWRSGSRIMVRLTSWRLVSTPGWAKLISGCIASGPMGC